MKAKMCKVLSLTLAMVLAFTLIPARELAASTNEDTSTDTVQTEEEAPADSAKDDKKEETADKAPEEKKDDPADKTPAEKTGDPEEKKQDEDENVQQGDKQPEVKPDEVAETTSATPDEDKKAPEPKNANQNRGTGKGELAFVTQPKGGTIEPQSDLKIEWETNFEPWRVEVGYFDGDQFKAVKEVTKKGDYTVSYTQVPIDKEYDTDLYYSSAVTSDKWILRAYLNKDEDSPFADSARFSITKVALKFVTQPEGGTVEPQAYLNIGWKTNFKPWRVEVGYFDGDQFKAVKEVTKKGDYTVSYQQVPIDKEYDTDLYYSSTVTSDKWILRAYLNEGEDSPFVDSARFSITKVALKFVTQPEGGTVEPQAYLNIGWKTNFKPWRVEVGYFDGDQFKAVKEVTKKGDYTVSYTQVPIDKEYDTDLYYSSAVTSDKWILRAYLNEGEDSPFADSARFSITKGALKFVTQPKGGTVEPQDYLNIGWKTNFKPWRVEVGYFDGDQFKAVKEVTKKGDYTVSYQQVPIDKEYDTDLYYSSAVTSDKWILRAYLNEGEDSPFVDSARFSITKVALKFVTQPEGGTVEPQAYLNIGWKTNFKPWRVEVGYFDGDQFKAVKEVTKKGDYTVSYQQVSIDKEYDTDLYYSSAVTSDKWILRAYLNKDEDSPFADSKPFTIIKAVYSGTCGNNLNWSYEDGALTIDGTGAMYNYDDTVAGSAPWHWLSDKITSVNIGSDVTTIGNYAFKDCKSLKNVDIPNNIRQIGDYSFYKAGLQSVTISSNIMLIPTGAFAENDLRNVTIPSGIIQINSNAFASNPNLWKVTFPSSLGSIGDCAFANCRINEIVLPEGLTSIGEGAFSNNKTVWGIKFPDSVTNIGARAFADCSALQKLEFEGGAPTIGSYAFSNVTAKAYYVIGLNGWASSTLKNYGGTITWVGLQKCGENLTWTLDSEGVLTITGIGAMQSNFGDGNRPGWYNRRSEIKTIYIMPGVESIGGHAFANCSNVNTIVFYGSAPKPGVQMFQGITANAYYTPDESWTDSKLVSYGGNITWIPSDGQCGDNLFWRIDENKILHITGSGDMYDYPGNISLPWYKWTEEIVGVEIASGCTSIGEGAFYSCSKIESVTMPSTVKTIGKNAFYRCSRLSSINLSSALTTIGESAFYYCYALSEVTIPDKVTVIDETAFMGCSSLKSVVIPDSVVTLGLRAFAQCSSLEYVEIGKGVTVIPGSAFSSCKNLTAVEFTGDVTAIYNYAFMGCSSLDYIELPASLKEMGMFAFSDCTSLSRIKIHDKLESLDYGVFSGCSALSEAFFYGTPEQWDAVTKGLSNTALINIIRCVRAEGDCSKNDSTEYSDVMWRLFWDGELVIDGYGEMASYSNGKDTKAPWLRLEAGSDITKVVISDGVTSVGRYAFLNCSNITSVELPDTLAKIEENAFYGCSSISEISIPENVKIIQNYAFYKCSSISSIRIPEGVTVIYASAFANCSALENVEIADGVRTIKGSAFYGCTSLVEINLPSSVTSIEMYAFSDCTHLVSIDLGGNVEFIGAGAFENCTKLVAITIPASVTTMQYRTFRNCSDLKTVIFEGNAIELSEYDTPFVNVNTYAYYPADNSTWTESARQMYGETIKWVPLGEGDIILKFSHNCSFGNNLAVGFYIPKAEVEGFENYRLIVKKQVFNASGSSFTWNETTLTDYIVEVQGGVEYYKFVYRGLAACEMGDELNATLYMEKDGNTYNTTPDRYSIKEYIYNRLKYSGDNTFKRLIVDMLNYGAAAQKYFNYNSSASHLVNADLTDEQKAYQTTVLNAESASGTDKTEGATARIIGKMVVFGNSTELKYFMQFDSGAPNDNVKLVLSYVAVNGETYTTTICASDFVYDSTYKAYTAKITSISAADMSSVITAKIYDGDTLISDVVYYSIETYVYNRLENSTDEAFKELASAMLKYGKSAKDYFLQKQL